MPNRRHFIQAAALAGSAALLCRSEGFAKELLVNNSSLKVIPNDQHIQIGALVFPNMDQIDLTGPYAVLSRLPNSSIQLLAKEKGIIRDHLGLGLVPDATLEEAKPIDLLLIPGGPGQEALMEDEAILSFIRDHAKSAKCVYSVCTGSLLCGAAGLLKDKQATTHWASLHLLKYFGAHTSSRRVVIDGNFVSAAGLTAGIDGALTVAAQLRGEEAAQAIQLGIQYAPEPPFDCGNPEDAPPEILKKVRAKTDSLTQRREKTAQRIAAKLGIHPS
ncbi:DJ-1/PfpI family protein [Blastopirellula marina]|uniref:AraC family transcriptional regulator n=1 Tax=Blastopirellula marina TaxID=124 RepID=A0A2S8GCQ9_9BACT|nr:DJ-1/PfpI family protein [Blastopirellula marina]PQO42203.1 AraC family transcriptional regulator [Blastopirellula marina]